MTAALQQPNTGEVATFIDQVEARILALGGGAPNVGEQLPEFPVTHRFTPGLYIRELFMPAGSVVVGKKHLIEHPYAMTRGRKWMYIEGHGWRMCIAPETGITPVGTQRLAVVLEDTVWTTYHPTTLTDVCEIERAIFAPPSNPLLVEAES
jgi:hypothetical protein